MAHCLWCGRMYTPPIRWTHLLDLRPTKGYCSRCFGKLKPISNDGKLCVICGRSLESLETRFVDQEMCTDCRMWEESEWGGVLLKNRSLYAYNDFLKELIARFKFRGDAVLIKGFEKELKQHYQKHFKGCMPVPIPVSPIRMKERAFNQALLIAELLPATPVHALQRISQNQKQSKKTKAERLKATENPFALTEEPLPMLKNKPVVLVDDIYTTGATLRHAALTLQALSPSAIYSMTLAR